MHSFGLRPFAILAAALLTLSSMSEGLKAGELRAQLEEIRDGYLANRSSFKHGSCTFRYSKWTADSEEDALAGRANDRREELFIINNLLFRDDIFIVAPDYDHAEVRQRLFNKEPLIPPMAFARIGDFAIDSDGLVGSAVIYNAETMDQFHVRAHPFALSRDLDYSVARAIDFAIARDFDGFEFAVDRRVRDGREYLVLESRSDLGSLDTVEYIDPARGYLSFITENTRHSTGEFYSRMHLLDVHEDDGRFFPMHAMTVAPLTSPEGAAFVDVCEMKVLELNLDLSPSDEDLVVPMHREIQYSDGVNPNTAKTLFRSSPTEFVDVSVFKIEEIYNGLQKLAVERLEGDKRRFLEFVRQHLADGAFSTDDPVHLRALLALTNEDLRSWWRSVAQERGEAFDPKAMIDLSPFLTISRGLSENERLQDEVITSFSDIRHPQLKLAWASLLFLQNKRPQEIVDFLGEAIDDDNHRSFLSEFLGSDWPDLKNALKRLGS